jgi:hypothetical protein
MPWRKPSSSKGRSLIILAVRNREPTSIGRQSIVCPIATHYALIGVA